MALSEEEKTIKIKYDKTPMEIIYKIIAAFMYTDELTLSTQYDSITFADSIVKLLEGSHFEEVTREDKIIPVYRTTPDGSRIKKSLKVKFIHIQKKPLL